MPKELHLLITHTHWDHIQGFPFFAPTHVPDIQIHLYGTIKGDDSRYQLLSGQMSSAYFPVGFGDLGARIVSDDLGSGVKDVNGVTVKSFPLNHPGGCHGYSFEKDGKKIVYMTDNEMEPQEGDTFPDPYHEGKLRKVPPALVEIAKGADLLIIDSQYDDHEYLTKKGWGHSSCNTTTDLAIQADVGSVALFHHDPESTDTDVEARVESCRMRIEIFKGKPTIFAAREGVELKF